ncbi:MAG: adenosine deaminase [Desulfitibacter sp. BRH_c19]|nr:MAG: adenosine deaminase [Desulfitibacter sp. BRH_c19]
MAELKDRALGMARGDYLADLVLKNCNIIDVFTGSHYNGDIAIVDGYIVGIGEYSGTEQIDIGGRFVAPGFIDGHVHIESSMVTPGQFAAAILPRGTTTIIADPHELANVHGTAAIEYFLKADEQIPLDIYLMLPSCVPATDLETSGATLTHRDLEQFIGHPMVLGLGEMMNYPGVIYGDPSVWDKLDLFNNHKMIIDGHIQSISGKQLSAYVLGGIGSNHECTTVEEALDTLRMGMRLMIREGSAAKNLKDLLPVVNQHTIPHCMLVTDDRHPTDLVSEGHLDYLIKLCINEGLSPIEAIQMVTINPARYFGLKHLGAVAPGCQADLVIISDLSSMIIDKVYKKGLLIAEKEKTAYPVVEQNPEARLAADLNVRQISKSDLNLDLSGDMIKVIGIIPSQLLTECLTIPVEKIYQQTEDIVKLVVVERHKGTGNVGVGLVQGFNIIKGAIASTVAHDSHNIVAVGDNDDDILIAIERFIKTKGGLAVVREGQVLGSLALPIGGLMSQSDLKTVVNQLESLEVAAHQIGVPYDLNPFMTLAFLSLPVIPHLRLTDKGLVDVDQFKIVSLSE